jgi:hypothetical protein
LKVTERFVVVEGSDGEALQQRQLAAIRQALAWLTTNPETRAGPPIEQRGDPTNPPP